MAGKPVQVAVRGLRRPGGRRDARAGHGGFARCTDTEGNPFGLWQSDPSAQMPQ